MAAGREIRVGDLPPDLRSPVDGAGTEEGPAGESEGEGGSEEWEKALARWADERLRAGDARLMDEAVPRFERTLIEVAFHHSSGLRHEAARLLGWGRNTLTRKLARESDSSPEGN